MSATLRSTPAVISGYNLVPPGRRAGGKVEDEVDSTVRVSQMNARRSSTGRLVRTYLWSQIWKERFFRLVQSLFTGVWLGILSQSDLESVDDAYFVGVDGKRKGPIDYTNAEYNKRGLFEWERRAIEAHFPAGGSIALMAAGGGREVLALRRLAFRVQAWECQPELVAAANELLVGEGFEPSVFYAPRNTAPTGTERYDGVVIGWGSYMLVPGRNRRIAMLRELRTRVDEGSPILLSFFARRPGDSQLRVAAQVGNVGRRLLGRERLEVGDFLEPNFVHRFTEDEIASELAAGGFELKSYAVTPYGHAIALAGGLKPPPAGNSIQQPQ